MICSNLRELRSWSLARNVADAATEDLLVDHPHLRYLVLQSCSNTIEQRFVVKRFRQKLHCACPQRLHPHSLVAMCRDEDDGNPAAFVVQLGLEFETGHPGHTDVGDQTCSLVLFARSQELFRRRKAVCWQVNRLQQVLDRTAHRVVIIDNGYKFGGSRSVHVGKLPVSGKAAQSHVGIMLFPAGGKLQHPRHFHPFRQRSSFHLLHRTAALNLHSDFAGPKFPSDLLIEHARNHQAHDLALACGQRLVSCSQLGKASLLLARRLVAI